MDECHTFGKRVSVIRLFHGPVISLLLCFALKNILVLLAKRDSDELHCPATAPIMGIFTNFNNYMGQKSANFVRNCVL